VTKALVIGVVFVSLLASIAGNHAALTLQAAPVLLRGEVWRLLTHSLLFSTPGELLFGTILLYYFRQFERHLSSSRFFALVAASSSIYTAVLLAVSAVYPAVPAAPGPYAPLAACILHFFLETPPLYTFTLFSLAPLSDKAFTYLLSTQLLLSALPASLLPSAIGLVAAFALRVPPLAESLDTPQPLVALASRILLPLLDTAPRAHSSRRSRRQSHRTAAAAAADGGGGGVGVGAGAGAGAIPAQEAPGGAQLATEQNVQAITAMGFSREQAQDALAQSGNDIQRATDRLLRT
jgi:membrane associated rhomboid family serine protease